VRNFRRPRLLAVALLAAVAAGCGGSSNDSSPAAVVTISERDFAIKAPTETVPAGEVVLRAVNRGPDAHELIVVRADSPVLLPLRGDGLGVDEDAVKHATAGALEPGAPGTVRDLRVRFKPGRYVLFCNMSGHFMGGMHTTLVVR
jgi:uncharacterized cupredoxin-like copper-binding protein